MNDPLPPETDPEPERHESHERDDGWWQWVALVVLLGCWLAEAGI